MNKTKIIERILVSPIILMLLTCAYIIALFKHFIKFIRYGGEWITLEKGDPKIINDIYELLKDQYASKKNNL